MFIYFKNVLILKNVKNFKKNHKFKKIAFSKAGQIWKTNTHVFKKCSQISFLRSTKKCTYIFKKHRYIFLVRYGSLYTVSTVRYRCSGSGSLLYFSGPDQSGCSPPVRRGITWRLLSCQAIRNPIIKQKSNAIWTLWMM